MKKIIVAVAWPYVNGPMHIGHLAGAYLSSDIFARYHRLKGNKVLMVSGSDMHGTPTAVLADKEGVEPIVVAERYHERDVNTLKSLDTTYDLYTKTSTQNHKEVVQDIFLTLLEKKYIFKDKMFQMYCETDKRFLPDRFVEGTCPHCGFGRARGDQCDNCGRTLDPNELIGPKCKICGNTPVEKETEHFFLDLPKFQKELKKFIEKRETVWKPSVTNFSLGWIKEGLKPRAITRDMNYGVPVPLEGYEDKVIYVWFEAVIGYLSASKEWAKIHNASWEEFWKDKENTYTYHFMGKDNIPFHTIIWPAELMGYDEELVLPYNIVANENLQLEGEKFSKSTGNYIEADYIIGKYGSDQVRYYITSTMPESGDSDFTWKGFIDAINNELVANLGNMVNRTITFVEKNFNGEIPEGKLDKQVAAEIKAAFATIDLYLGDGLDDIEKKEEYQRISFQSSIRAVMKLAQFANRYFDENKPWADKPNAGNTMYNMLQIIASLAILTNPFLPKTSAKINAMFGMNQNAWKFTEVPAGTKVTNPGLLFAKIDEEAIEEERALLKK